MKDTSSETGVFRRTDGRRFEGAFFNDFPTEGTYFDEQGKSYSVVFNENTKFSRIGELGDDMFRTKIFVQVPAEQSHIEPQLSAHIVEFAERCHICCVPRFAVCCDNVASSVEYT